MGEQPVNLGSKLIMDGFVYNKSKSRNGKTNWDCRRVRKHECGARAITYDSEPGEQVITHKRPSPQDHDHPPNFDEAESEILKAR